MEDIDEIDGVETPISGNFRAVHAEEEEDLYRDECILTNAILVNGIILPPLTGVVPRKRYINDATITIMLEQKNKRGGGYVCVVWVMWFLAGQLTYPHTPTPFITAPRYSPHASTTGLDTSRNNNRTCRSW